MIKHAVICTVFIPFVKTGEDYQGFPNTFRLTYMEHVTHINIFLMIHNTIR